MKKRIFSTATISFFSIVVLYTTIAFQTLPPFIHSALFNDWQTRAFIFLPLLIGIVLWSFLHILEHHPEWHEFCDKNSENRELSYKNSTALLNALKNGLLCVLSTKTAIEVYTIIHPHTTVIITGPLIVFIALFIAIIAICWRIAKPPQELSNYSE